MPDSIQCCVCGRELQDGHWTLAEYVDRQPGGAVCSMCSRSD
jgi:hypothetical protein